MDYVRLGSTGLQVSPLCLGCMSYGSSEWRAWVHDEQEARPFFRQAIEAGINFFDTADIYSNGVSEEVTGRAVREFGDLDECVIATKLFGALRPGPNRQGLSRKHIQQACEASLRRLGVDCIDLYQVHRLDPHTPIEETLEALHQLVAQGKVRYIGASSAFAWELMRCLSISERNGWARFATMQNHYNLVYREEEREMLPLCETEKIGCIPWSPLARGLLGGNRTALDDKSSTLRAGSDELSQYLYVGDSDWEVVEALRTVAKARETPMAQVALAWLLSKPAVVAPIVGVTKLSHLEDALGALEVQLSPEEIAALEAPYRPHEIRSHIRAMY